MLMPAVLRVTHQPRKPVARLQVELPQAVPGQSRRIQPVHGSRADGDAAVLGDLLEPDAAAGAPALALDGHLYPSATECNSANNFQIAQEN